MDAEGAQPADGKEELESLIRNYHGLALEDLAQGDPKGALISEEAIIQYVGQLHGEDSWQYLSELQTLARYQANSGAYEDAVETLTRILGKEQDFMSKESPAESREDGASLSFESVRNDLADAQKNMESYEQAEANYRQILQKADSTKPGHVMRIVSAKQGLALVCVNVGKDEEALQLANESIDLVAKHFSGDPLLLKTARDILADVHYVLGDFEKLLEVHQQTYDSLVKADGEDSSWAELAKESLAQAWVLNRREEDARKVLEWPSVMAMPSRTEDEPKRIAALWYKALSTAVLDGTCYGDIEQMNKILSKLENRDMKPYLGVSGPEGRGLLRDHLRVCWEQGRIADWDYKLNLALREIAQRLGEDHIGTAQLLEIDGKAAFYGGADFEGAVELLKKVRETYSNQSGANSYRTKQCDDFLKALVNDEGALDGDKLIGFFESDWNQKVQKQGAESHAAHVANIVLVKALDYFGHAEKAATQLRKSVLRPMADIKMAKRALDAAPFFQAFSLSEESLRLQFEALSALETEQGLVSTDVFMTISGIGRSYGAIEEWDKAIDIYKRMIDRAAIFQGTESTFVEEGVQAWKVVNIYRGVDDEASERIPNDYVKDSANRWKEARKANLTSFKPFLEDFAAS